LITEGGDNLVTEPESTTTTFEAEDDSGEFISETGETFITEDSP
jgi:hypothetical protein